MEEHKSFKCRQVTLREKETGEQLVFPTMAELHRAFNLSLHWIRKAVDQRLSIPKDGRVYEVVDVTDTDTVYGKCVHQGQQPCITCRNCYDGCSWARTLTPVKGWIAEPNIHRGVLWSWRIIECPEYERG